MSAGCFRPLLDSVNGRADLVKGFSGTDIRGQESSAAGHSLVLVSLDRVDNACLVDGRKAGSVPMLRGIVGHLRHGGALGVDGCFLAFAPADGPAPCSAPFFYAVELTADDINLDVDPVFLGSVSEALVMLAAPADGAGFGDLHRARLVPTEDVGDNLAQAAASAVAPRHGGA